MTNQENKLYCRLDAAIKCYEEYKSIKIMKVGVICDLISWASKFHKLPSIKCVELADRMTNVLDSRSIDFYDM